MNPIELRLYGLLSQLTELDERIVRLRQDQARSAGTAVRFEDLGEEVRRVSEVRDGVERELSKALAMIDGQGGGHIYEIAARDLSQEDRHDLAAVALALEESSPLHSLPPEDIRRGVSLIEAVLDSSTSLPQEVVKSGRSVLQSGISEPLKLKLTLPIIPLFLACELEVPVNLKGDLNTIWDKIVGWVRRRPNDE